MPKKNKIVSISDPDVNLEDSPNPDYSYFYKKFTDTFKETKEPIEVNFRSLVDIKTERFSHLIHTYPAKLLSNIPYFFLNCSSIIKNKGTVLDPFSGSGTVLLESILAGYNAIGSDSNPAAKLITKVKVTPIEKDELFKSLKFIIRSYRSTKNIDISPQKILDWDYWYYKKTKNNLSLLLKSILKIEDQKVQNFFKVCFSNCARKVSLADPNVSVPVKLNPERYSEIDKKYEKTASLLKKLKKVDVINIFEKIALINIKRLSKLHEINNLGIVKDIYDDSRNLDKVSDESVDLIITSPPYAGAQKYIRAMSLSIGWLHLCPDNQLRNLERKNIGREHYSTQEYKLLVKSPVKEAHSLLQGIFKVNPLRAHIAANYLIEMKEALKECYRVLKKDKYFVLVVGNNIVCGNNFETQKYLTSIAKELGFKIELILRDDIKSRGLMTKRNKTASLITCEWIIVLRK